MNFSLTSSCRFPIKPRVYLRSLAKTLLGGTLFLGCGTEILHASCLGGLPYTAGVIDEWLPAGDGTATDVNRTMSQTVAGVVNYADLYQSPNIYYNADLPSWANLWNHTPGAQPEWEHAVQTTMQIEFMTGSTNLGITGHDIMGWDDVCVAQQTPDAFGYAAVTPTIAMNQYKYVAVVCHPDGSTDRDVTFIDGEKGINLPGIGTGHCAAIMFRSDSTSTALGLKGWLDFYEVDGSQSSQPDNVVPDPTTTPTRDRSTGLYTFSSLSVVPNPTTVSNFHSIQGYYAGFIYKLSYPVSNDTLWLTMGSTAAAIWTDSAAYMPYTIIDGSIITLSNGGPDVTLPNGATGPVFSPGSSVNISWSATETTSN